MLTGIVALAPAGAHWGDLALDMNPQPGASLVLLDVTGLEPVAAEITSRPYGVVDGEFHVGSRVGKRNIVMKLGLLEPNARDMVYGFFPTKMPLRLRLLFDNRDSVEIDGHVETTIPTERFSESPDLPKMQVSILCPKPYFQSELMTVTGVTGVDLETAPETTLPYGGTVGGGFTFEMELEDTGHSGPFELVTRIDGTTSYRKMQFNDFGLSAWWKIFISTHQGAKRAEFRPPDIFPDEDPISMLGDMVDTYFWTQLFAATHKVQVLTPDSALARPWTIQYYDQFAGV